MVRVVVALALALLQVSGAHAADTKLAVVNDQTVDGGVFVQQFSAAVSHGEQGGYKDDDDDVCTVSDWKPEGECEAKTLTQEWCRTITSKRPAKGVQCPPLKETRPCKPVHCRMDKWSEWDDCDQDGFKERTRSMVVKPLYGGRECPHSIDKVKCCLDDCRVEPWKNEGTCDKSTGEQKQTRKKAREAKPGGADCKKLERYVPCPVDCELKPEDSSDPDLSECEPNEYGELWTKTKERTVKYAAKNGGAACPNRKYTEDCPKVDCEFFKESEVPWSDCTGPVTSAYVSKTLGEKTKAKYGGKGCTDPPVGPRDYCTAEQYFKYLENQRHPVTTLSKNFSVKWGRETQAFEGRKSAGVKSSFSSTSLKFAGGEKCGKTNREKRGVEVTLEFGTTISLVDFTPKVETSCQQTSTMKIPLKELANGAPYHN